MDSKRKEDIGCGGVIVVLILLAIHFISYVLIDFGEDQIFEKSKQVLGYRPEIIKVHLEEIQEYRDRVFESRTFTNNPPANPGYIKKLTFEEFQNLIKVRFLLNGKVHLLM
jgi:hypothetical protein